MKMNSVSFNHTNSYVNCDDVAVSCVSPQMTFANLTDVSACLSVGVGTAHLLTYSEQLITLPRYERHFQYISQ
jgi:hypothetical protein